MELTINFDILKKSGLFVEEFIFLQMVKEGKYNIEDVPNWADPLMEETLERNLWVRSTEEGYELRGKARELFEQFEPKINFDEFWDAFPSSTPKGRPLRAGSKEWGGNPTRDYTVCKKKYLAKVKNIPTHNKIVAVVKARVATGDYEFMNNMETYINQQKWQQDVKYLKQDKDWTTQRV